MRQRYQNRSIFGLVFWSLLLGGASLYTAWKFEWLSIDLSEMIGRRTESAENSEPAVAGIPSEASSDRATVDGAVFHDQSEPPVEFVTDETPELTRPEQETTARLRELQQRHPSREMTPGTQGAIDPDFSARVPSNPFANRPHVTVPDRSPGDGESYLGDDSAQPRVADFRPDSASRYPTQEPTTSNQMIDRRAAASGVSRRGPQQLGRHVPPNDGGSVSRDPRAAEEVIQASNEEPQLAAAPVTDAVAKALREIDRMLDANDVLGAHRELSKAYWSHPELRGVLRQRIEKTAETIYFSPQPHFLEPYFVQDGDQFAKFAKMYDVPWQYLARLNRVDPTRIRAGQKLKVIRGPFSAVVELSRFELTIHAHGYFVRRYDVGIGKQGSSPVGKHVVLEKVANPQYTDPDGRVIDADDPSNPLGERWIDLGDGYGIHGTIEPNSIGKAESRGCIRLRNDDIAEVYDLLGVGSEVVIRP